MIIVNYNNSSNQEIEEKLEQKVTLLNKIIGLSQYI